MNRDSHRLLLEPLEERNLLSTCHVTRLGDTGNGSGPRGDLRYCIKRINTEGGPAVIDFLKAGKIKLDSQLPYMNTEIEIRGPGVDLLTIDGQQKARVFAVSARGIVTISGMTIANGLDVDQKGGGGVYNQGVLVLENTVVENNIGYDRGGGIYNQANLTIISSTISENFVARASCCLTWGGGIYNSAEASLSMYDSHVIGNSLEIDVTNTPSGGGIANLGIAVISYSTISGNAVNDPLERARGGNGGGIFNGGDLLMDSSLIANNVVAGDLYAMGGGIANGGCTVEWYCAATYPAGTLRVFNSTIVDNLAYAVGDGFGEAVGGGISSRPEGSVTIEHSTIVSNSADRLNGNVDAIGGGVGSYGTVLQIRNTIVADNDAVSAGNDLFGLLATSGFNIFQDASGGSGYSEDDSLNIDPFLGPLGDNGGHTLTVALLSGSPAIDAGDSTDAPEFDQRGPGFPRIVNGTVDIGAFEVQLTGIGLPRDLLAVLSTADFETEDTF